MGKVNWEGFKRGVRRGKEAVANCEGFAIHQGNVYSLHLKGWAPSQIDELMYLPKGMARELIVAYWYRGMIGR